MSKNLTQTQKLQRAVCIGSPEVAKRAAAELKKIRLEREAASGHTIIRQLNR